MELYNALAKAQSEMRAATFDAVNPAFKSRYATLASVIAAVQGPLTRHGIAFSQRVESDADTVSVETILMGHGSELRCGAVRIPVGKPGLRPSGLPSPTLADTACRRPAASPPMTTTTATAHRLRKRRRPGRRHHHPQCSPIVRSKSSRSACSMQAKTTSLLFRSCCGRRA